ncbi:alpha-L-fucosidase [candidate division KSB1 bacterium]|nr:alpha-L-fucosidase [candidate division KSB1 bacterium]RQW01889.1 MAG: alpha-L-fucosidase [candidate division KSB1 bacterium]
MKFYFTLVMGCFSLTLLTCTTPQQPRSKEEAVEQWREDKFSLFIHWGLYSTLGGEWKGERVSRGYSEQIRAHANISREEYAALAQDFNPVNWDANAICELAKAAGMRSIVFTAKHHDGFNMFDSDYSDFNIADATPFGRDVVKELAKACERHGLKLGLYYSLIDWNLPEARISSHNSDQIPAKHEEYNAQQIAELVTKYGPISELWFDMGAPTAEQSKRFAGIVRQHQPFCLVSGRISNDQGDFNVMGDNFSPGFKMELPWQSPASMFPETWGYRSWQERGDDQEKVVEKIRALVRVVSRGGAYLLNIGPMGDGAVVPFEADVLRGIGDWLKVNGDAIYGTEANPFDNLHCADATCKEGIIYLHVVDWPADNIFKLPGLQNAITRAYLLKDEKQQLSAAPFEDGQILTASKDIERDSAVTVIAVEYDGQLKIRPARILDAADKIELTSDTAVESYSFSQPEYYSSLRTTVKRTWNIEAAERAEYVPMMRYTEQEAGKALLLTIDGQSHTVLLDRSQPEPINDSSPLQIDRLFKIGGFEGCSLGATHGRTHGIDPIFTWSLRTMQRWQIVPNWTSSAIITGDDGDFAPTYFYQRIYAGEDMDYLVAIGSDDGLQVWLNGEQLLLKYQKNQNDLNRDVLKLSLKKGLNELLYKNYNRFGDAPLSFIDYRLSQTQYSKKLAPIELMADVNTLALMLGNAESIHQDLGLINFEFWLEKK